MPQNHTRFQFSITPRNENSVMIDFFDGENASPSPELSKALGHCRTKLLEAYPNSIDDCIASYTSLLVYYDFMLKPLTEFLQEITLLLNESITEPSNTQAVQRIEIPVFYDALTGPDLKRLAQEKQLSTEEIIKRHSQTEYTAYAVGFSPGFAYLGFVDDQLATPRLTTPRTRVPKGSVGIADAQTGIYPSHSPGGWNIIGRTPLDILSLDSMHKNMGVINVGDTICFKAITQKEYLALDGEL